MPDQPGEDVYHAAARALVTAQGGHMAPRTRDTLAAGWVRRDDFRAAVDEAWRAGRASWRRHHPLPICDGGEVVMVTDVKAWLSGGTDG